MSSPTGEATTDSPTTVTPNSMPGAKGATPPAVVNPDARAVDAVDDRGQQTHQNTEAPDSQTDPTGEPETVEIERFKAIQKIAREQEKLAKANKDDADRYRAFAQAFSGSTGEQAPPDPVAEVQKLRDELNAERTERLREKVSAAMGVPATQIAGGDEEAMRASANQQLAWARQLMQQAGVPLAAPAANVTSSQAPHDSGTKQIQSRDELKNMSPQQIQQAHKDGRLDHLMGKK